MFEEEFFVSQWAVIGAIVGTGGSLLILTASVITLTLAYRAYRRNVSVRSSTR